MSATPAFQFYPQDFLVGTAELSDSEVGAYIRLLCYQWAKFGLPNDDQKLANLAGSQLDTITAIKSKFKLEKDGFLRNQKLEEIRKKQEEYSKKQAKIAKKAWEKRLNLNQKTRVEDGKPDGKPQPTQMPVTCSSSSSSSSSSNNNKTSGVDSAGVEEKDKVFELESGDFKQVKTDNLTKTPRNDSRTAFTDLWCSEYKLTLDRKYAFQGVKDSQAATFLLKLDMLPHEIIEIAKAAWVSKDEWVSSMASGLASFAKYFNQIRARVSPKKADTESTEEFMKRKRAEWNT